MRKRPAVELSTAGLFCTLCEQLFPLDSGILFYTILNLTDDFIDFFDILITHVSKRVIKIIENLSGANTVVIQIYNRISLIDKSEISQELLFNVIHVKMFYI